MLKFLIGITGASGSIYGIRLLEELIQKGYEINLIITSAGREVIKEEIGHSFIEGFLSKYKYKIKIWDENDYSAPFISGSNSVDYQIIIPCSMGKLSAIANGISKNILERSADVVLKEKKQLILVVRETPLNLIHLENMLKVAKAGALIVPAMPAFYHKPETVDDIVNFLVGKILNLIGIEHNLFKKWKA